MTDHEERFKLITDAIPHMVWEIAPDGKVTYINKQWEDWTKLSLDQINSGGWTEFFHPDDWPNVASGWKQSMENKVPYQGESRIRNAAGDYFWFNLTTLPVNDSKGAISKWIGTATNIDLHKSSQHALKESETQFRQLADAMPQQVWTADANGNLDYVNSVVVDYFGRPENEIIGHGWQDVVHPDDVNQVVIDWSRCLRNLEPYQVEFRLRDKDGNYRWHLARARCFVNKAENIRWFGTNTDIQKHKLNEIKKDVFISMASHELKTPVTSIKGYANILQRKFEREGNEDVVELVTRMDAQVNKLTKLIGDFLSVSKIEQKQFQLDKQEFNFRELVEECVQACEHTSPTHKVIIEKNEDLLILGDRLRLEQVISNFLSNAIKYSPDAETVLINCTNQFNNIVFSVQDFGIGIEKQNLGNIFDRFYRVDNTSMKFQGLGLGLYISSEIIKAHDGSFWIESEPGVGSTFYFLLPLEKPEERKTIRTDNQNFYSDPQIKIQFDEDYGWLSADWIGFQNLHSVQNGCMIMLDLLKKNKCSMVLNDNTHVLGNWSEAADWGGNFWFPEMQKAGLKYFAWVYSPSTFSKLSAHKSFDIMAGNITTQFFTDIEEAKLWLLKTKEQ